MESGRQAGQKEKSTVISYLPTGNELAQTFLKKSSIHFSPSTEKFTERPEKIVVVGHYECLTT